MQTEDSRLTAAMSVTTRLYLNQNLTEGEQIKLEDAPFHHLCKVLRARAGEHCILFNGDGRDYRAEITSVAKRHADLSIQGSVESRATSPLALHLGQVISKGDRMDYVVQKMTELGVSELSPLFSERCDVKLSEDRQQKRREHWQQVAIHASEQCGRATIPKIHSPISIHEWLGRRSEPKRWVLDFESDGGLIDSATAAAEPSYGKGKLSAALLVGPEGGLSAREVNGARDQGFARLRLGSRILRTETAPVVAASLLQYFFGDLA